MPPPSLVADRFVLERPAGSGGMGTVYRALDRQSGAVVALKLVTSDAPSLRARALVEADALAALDHPAIVRLIAHGLADDGRPFLAMEWLEGEDLAARLARAPLTALEAVRLGARVAAALTAAHARGVLHRDLKPSNLFLPGGDVAHVKLVDFGIARLTQARQRLTAPGAYLGTPGYMAPEQVSGDAEFGPAVDLFALGAVLFECLAGRPAFGGASPVARLAKVLLDEPPRLDALRADLSLALTDLVTGLLAKDPACRPTAAAAASALASLRSAVEPALPSAGAPTLAAEGLSGAEQRLVCVLLARIPPDGGAEGGPDADEGAEGGASADEETEGLDALDTTLPADVAPRLAVAERDALARLRTLVASLGGRAHELMEGALVAAWLGPGVPRDQAALAARAALLARDRLPGVALALASGLTETERPVPLGSALDRAAALLDRRVGPSDAVPLDHVTAGLLDARFVLRESAAGPELCGLRAPDEEEARLLLGRPVPCVGRERELRALGDLLDECVAEPVARAVLVTAPAGGGKSRLRQEFLRQVRLRGDADVWAAGADELSAGSPFALLGGALQRAAGTRPGEPLEQRQRALAQRVARHVPEAERARVAAFLGEIAAAPLPAAAHPALAAARRDPALMVEQVRRAWLELLAAETAAHPVLLVLEDLHWGDAPTLQLVGAALAALRERPFFVLALARPEVRERFADPWAGREVQEMRLGGLTRRAAAQLVRHALPEAGEGVLGRLVERADGNALYLEELVRAAAAGHADALPETIAAMLQARLGTLAPEQRRLLRAASAFGEVFWPSGVQALLGAGQGLTPVAEGLEALLERELLVRRAEGRFPAEPELGFRHALVRDSAYATFTEADRARAHRAAARWLEQAGEADPLVLATHYERSGEPGRAAACYHRAAGIFVSMASGASELFSFEGATVEGVKDSAESAAPLIPILSALVLFLGLAGQRPFAVPYLERAEALVEALGSGVDPSSLGTFHFNRCCFRFWVKLDLEAALHDGEEAIRCRRTASEPLQEGLAHLQVGIVLCHLGAFERALAEFHGAEEKDAPGARRVMRAIALVELGARGEAEREASEGLVEAQATNNRFAEAEARSALAYVLQACGEPAAAERAIREGLAQGSPTVAQRANFHVALAEALLAQDRADEALALAREVVTSHGENLRMAWLRASAVQAEALRAVGDHAAARALLAACRAELLALATRITDDELRASFLGRGLYTARLLRLAEAEGLGAGAGG